MTKTNKEHGKNGAIVDTVPLRGANPLFDGKVIMETGKCRLPLGGKITDMYACRGAVMRLR